MPNNRPATIRASRLLSLLMATTGAFAITACTQLPQTKATAGQEPAEASEEQPKALYEWDGGGRGISRVVIDLDEQKAIFYNGADRIGWSSVATGIDYFATPKGQFKITEKVADKRSNLYGRIYSSSGKLAAVNARKGVHRIPPGGRFQGANMPYFMRLTSGGVGMHGGPIPDPGTPASHGCIRLPQDIAPIVFDHVRVGTPVKIVGSAKPTPSGT